MQINHKLIDEFIANADWYSVWNEDNFSEINPEAMAKDLDYNKFNWMCGATKMVFQPVDMTENYVIKIPFRYVGDENYDYDDEDEDSSPYYYNEILYAPLPKSGVYNSGYYTGFYQYTWDYCATEVQYCDLAAEAGISDFFPTTIQYCETPYPVYIQETCYPVYQKHDRNTPEARKERRTMAQYLRERYSEDISNWCYTFNPLWIKDAMEQYGEEKVTKLFEFMSHYQMKDFHSANYGYRKSDNSPVLIDFAGFYEE